MMLDHGCDALTCGILTIGLTTMFGFSKGMQVTLLCSNCFLFFMAFLEQ